MRVSYSLLFYFVFNLLGFSQTKSEFGFYEFGGDEQGSELFQRTYYSDANSEIVYNKWDGIEVSSNKELERVLKLYPDIEAIKFWDNYYGQNDTLYLTDKIGDFDNLKYLEISTVNPTIFPKNIERLTTLEYIVLDLSKEEEIQFSFSNFQNLKVFSLESSGKLKEFPFSVFECEKLEEINLRFISGTNQKTLNGIEKIKNLRKIYITHSDLNLPQDVEYNYPQLETLCVHPMKQALPSQILNSKTITRLALTGPQDTLDFASLAMLENLESLYLSDYSGMKGTLKFKNLRHLEITDYNGEEIKMNFNEYKYLESLVIWGCNNLSELGPISNPSLRSLMVVSNDKLSKIHLEENSLSSFQEAILFNNLSLLNQPNVIAGINVANRRR